MTFKKSHLIGALCVSVAIAALAAGAQAHHAFSAEFDGNAPVLLKGNVSKVEWINPHAWVHVNVVGQAGKRFLLVRTQYSSETTDYNAQLFK